MQHVLQWCCVSYPKWRRFKFKIHQSHYVYWNECNFKDLSKHSDSDTLEAIYLSRYRCLRTILSRRTLEVQVTSKWTWLELPSDLLTMPPVHSHDFSLDHCDNKIVPCESPNDCWIRYDFIFSTISWTPVRNDIRSLLPKKSSVFWNWQLIWLNMFR